MRPWVKGFSGNTIDEIAESVGEFVELDKFEMMVKNAYPDGMDDHAKLTLLTAIGYNMSDNRKKYYQAKHGIELNSYYSHELNVLPEAEIVKANRAIAEINKPFEKALNFIIEHYK